VDEFDELEAFYRMMGLAVPRRQRPQPEEEEEEKVSIQPAKTHATITKHVFAHQPEEQQQRKRPQQRSLTAPMCAKAQPPRNRAPIPVPTRSSHESPKPTHTPEQHVAVEKIQMLYHQHATCDGALATIASLKPAFATYKSTFAPPPTFDFLVDGKPTPLPTANIPLPAPDTDFNTDEMEEAKAHVPKLAYMTGNKSVHAHEEELSLLGKLDAVESGGDQQVQDTRYALVRAVKLEALRMEIWKGGVWRAAQSGQVSVPAHHLTKRLR
jgi:hypothetical protein